MPADPILPPANGLCAQSDPEAFFPGQRRGGNAKQLCRICPARLACLRFTVQAPRTSGVWAGFTGEGLRNVRRRHRAGESLEAIIAEDDERYYASLEAVAA